MGFFVISLDALSSRSYTGVLRRSYSKYFEKIKKQKTSTAEPIFYCIELNDRYFPRIFSKFLETKFSESFFTTMKQQDNIFYRKLREQKKTLSAKIIPGHRDQV